MKNLLQKTILWTKSHKIISIVILVVIVGALGYGVVQAFKNNTTETKYILAVAEKGNIVSSVSGTGQVSASNQVDVTSKVSGDIVYLNAISGREVKAGTLLAQIDAGNISYEVETAKLSYEKLITTHADDLHDAEDSVTDSKSDLEDAYTNARASLTNASTDMADILVGVDDIFNGYLGSANKYGVSKTAKGYIDRAEKSWYSSDNLLNDLIKKYRTIGSSTSKEDFEAIISKSYEVAISVAETVKYTQDATVYMRDREYDEKNTEADDAYTSVTSLVSKANTVVKNISSAKSSITDGKRTLATLERELEDLKKGPDTLDMRAEEISLRQKKDTLADYYIRAPFDGIIASVDVKNKENISSNTKVATLITKQKIAEISLNEIDVAKVKVGQKATLTFDALDNLTISGEVVEVDLVGTVSQGVVNYTVKINFDTDNDSVRPGMTVSANIITEMKQDVITVPIGAVKTKGNTSYVEIVNKETVQNEAGQKTGVTLLAKPIQKEVVTGMSNDELIEIVSGISVGDQYVVRTINTSAIQATTQSATGLFGGSTKGVRTGGGSFPR